MSKPRLHRRHQNPLGSVHSDRHTSHKARQFSHPSLGFDASTHMTEDSTKWLYLYWLISSWQSMSLRSLAGSSSWVAFLDSRLSDDGHIVDGLTSDADHFGHGRQKGCDCLDSEGYSGGYRHFQKVQPCFSPCILFTSHPQHHMQSLADHVTSAFFG
jgi:hypothetical protein